MKRYRFLREADAEFQEQISYFDKQASGLGDRFIADVDATVADIREYPESGSSIHQICGNELFACLSTRFFTSTKNMKS